MDGLDNAFEGVDGSEHQVGDSAAVEGSPTEGGQAAVSSEEKSWSEYGLPEDFNTMKRDAMAQRVKAALFREKQWGEQGNAIGDLRKRNQELESLMRKGLGEEKPAEEQLEALGPEDKKYLDFIKPHLGIRTDEQVQEMVSKITNEILQQYDDYNHETRYKESNQDWSEYDGYVNLLKSDEHFGQSRSYGERQKFARLVNENKAVADVAYGEMKAHPTMSFERAKKIAELELGAQKASEETEGNLTAQVSKVAPTKAGGKSQKSASEKISSMDDAFDVD